MQLGKRLGKSKVYLLIVGVLVVFFLAFTGRLFENIEQGSEDVPIANEELLILGTEQTVEGLGKQEIYTDKGIYQLEDAFDCTPYLYQSVQAVTEDKKILHINNLLQREVKLQNCLIVENTKDLVTIFSEGFRINIPCKNLSAQFSDEIVDIYLTNGSITKISTKKESIEGKILAVRPEGIELEGYGVVPVSEKFRFYETYGEYAEKSAYGLIVGYEQAKLIVAEGEICAAVLDAPISLEKIRVLLKTTNFAEIVHTKVDFKAVGEYDVFYGGKEMVLHDGENLSLDMSSEYLQKNRLILTPRNNQAKLEILSIERSCGTPAYAGRVEVVKDAAGLLIINELDLESYLYGVVPSEMPASYELEALKAQAVCARSYAYRQILLNGYAAYGAHIDDSVSYQVYNNLKTEDKVIQAVNETAGKVLKFGEEVATTYYFSTSCGHTTNETIWKNGSTENRYISGKLLNDSKEHLDLTKEEDFRAFILNTAQETYDSSESWYRWEVTVPVKQIHENVCKIENVGDITGIQVLERNEGGVVQKVKVLGEKGELELEYEHAIRSALNGSGQKILRNNGSDATGGSLLPSGFFVVDPVEENGELTGFRFQGGGFGHGAGMSQNGANHMAKAGKSYEEILTFFYEGTALTDI